MFNSGHKFRVPGSSQLDSYHMCADCWPSVPISSLDITTNHPAHYYHFFSSLNKNDDYNGSDPEIRKPQEISCLSA